MGTPKYSSMDFTVNNLMLMKATSIPLFSLVLPQTYIAGPFLAVFCYWFAWRSEITKHLFSSERWMKQMLFYVVPAIYVAGVVLALVSAMAARIYAAIGVFVITFLWQRCGEDYRKMHFQVTDKHAG
jgi:hypothetical protein